MSDKEADARAEYVQRVAAYWENGGLTHAAGLILGHLMVCDPAEQTQSQLASALDLSMGSVSTQLRTLTAAGMVERQPQPGSRAAVYRLPQDMWIRILGTETGRIAGLRALADAGLAVAPASRPDRIGSLDQMVRFFEREWPLLEQRLDEFLRKEGS